MENDYDALMHQLAKDEAENEKIRQKAKNIIMIITCLFGLIVVWMAFKRDSQIAGPLSLGLVLFYCGYAWLKACMEDIDAQYRKILKELNIIHKKLE